MKIILIPAAKQLVNISITLIQALSKTCWRTGPLCWSYQSVTTCQKFARMLQPCLLPSGAQHDKLNPIIDYHISSTQVFFVIFGTKNHCQNQSTPISSTLETPFYWRVFLAVFHTPSKNLSVFLSLPFSTHFKASSIPYLTTEFLKQATNNMVWT